MKFCSDRLPRTIPSFSGENVLAGLFAILCSFLCASSLVAEPPEPRFELGTNEVPASPKPGWRELPTESEPSTTRTILLWLPNRILDLIDIIKVDVGAGPAAGAVVRVTEYGQVGYRQMMPASARVGIMGRQSPITVETSNEIGVGPLFAQSSQRHVCPGEVGLGIDLFLVGGYAGVCVDELVDFVGGIFLFDIKDDDFE